ncbi:hypothetical protein BS78_05G244900 [Paspalum vaginatum]|nr:hypothetical protein BS78_05G244900 [Paspalum vaginatum]
MCHRPVDRHLRLAVQQRRGRNRCRRSRPTCHRPRRYVFTLYNKDMKPRPTLEQNYGLFYYPNGSPTYAMYCQLQQWVIRSRAGYGSTHADYIYLQVFSSSKSAIRAQTF